MPMFLMIYSNVTSQQMGRFSDTVRDELGAVYWFQMVFEPLLQDISGLQQMGELF